MGKPIWGTELQIWDNEGRPLPPGRDNVGELVTRGFHVMKGYLNDPEATAEAFAGGWFHTGDLGYLDDDGFVFIVDRKKELIIRGGYNVYPREVEEVLYSHPAIAEAAVVGIPHHQLGEEIKAFVALKPGQELIASELIASELIASELIASELIASELIAYCKERVAAYKYPRVVEVRDELPKSATGKVLKKQLK